MKVKERIGFDEIKAGDLLSVSYQEGPNNSMYSVTRSIVATAAVGALNKVWLNEDGHTIAHRGWDKLRIVRLEGSSV